MIESDVLLNMLTRISKTTSGYCVQPSNSFCYQLTEEGKVRSDFLCWCEDHGAPLGPSFKQSDLEQLEMPSYLVPGESVYVRFTKSGKYYVED